MISDKRVAAAATQCPMPCAEHEARAVGVISFKLELMLKHKTCIGDNSSSSGMGHATEDGATTAAVTVCTGRELQLQLPSPLQGTPWPEAGSDFDTLALNQPPP